MIESTRPIRGFLLVGEDNMQFTKIPDHSEFNMYCGGTGRSAVSHVSNIERGEPLVFDFVCTGEYTKISAYLVFDYKTPFVMLEGMVSCPVSTVFGEAQK